MDNRDKKLIVSGIAAYSVWGLTRPLRKRVDERFSWFWIIVACILMTIIYQFVPN